MSIFTPPYVRSYNYGSGQGALHAINDAAFDHNISEQEILVEFYVATGFLTRQKYNRIQVTLYESVDNTTRRLFWHALNHDSRVWR